MFRVTIRGTFDGLSDADRAALLAGADPFVAAFTEATSPRTMAVTSPASTFCHPTNATFAVLTIASVASTMPTKPRVSMRPRASPGSNCFGSLAAAVMGMERL